MIVTETVLVVPGVTATFRFDADTLAFVTEWEPAPPRSLTGRARENYFGARARFIQKVGAAIHGTVAVVDDAGTVSIITPPKEGRA